ncbi:MAG: hypothetical protein FWH29_04300 [Methanobrevibacter sp.]|nr:hypothetical protein [Methanobrevibacter sp.]
MKNKILEKAFYELLEIVYTFSIEFLYPYVIYLCMKNIQTGLAISETLIGTNYTLNREIATLNEKYYLSFREIHLKPNFLKILSSFFCCNYIVREISNKINHER